MTGPEPCLDGYCRSPVACGGWGYCRERNFKDGVPSLETQRQWREQATIQSSLPAVLAALAQAGIPPDVQELLVNGDPARGIAPGALKKALTHLHPARAA